jgi:TonB family protein
MNRSETYWTGGKGADDCELAWEPPEEWRPAERRAIQPPPPALWRSLGRDARAMRSFAPLPVPPCGVGAPEVAPTWSGPVGSFFAPSESGAWARGADPESAQRRPTRPQPLPIPIPPVPRIASAPPRARASRPWPPERARMMLRLEDERDAGLPLERRLFGLPLWRAIGVCGAALLGAALASIAIDGSPTEGAALITLSDAPATALNGMLQASAAPESKARALPATTPLDAAAKRALRAGVARGSFRHRARAPRAERAIVSDDSVPAPLAPTPAVEQVARSVTRAVLISSPRPRYPELARKRGIGGSVVVGFAIDAHGWVRDAAIESADPPGLFDRAALHAIENTRYRPRIEDGQAVTTPKATKRFTFRVRSRSD